MSFTLLSIAILAITAVLIYRHVRLGYKRGLTKSLTVLAIMLFSAVVGALLSSLISDIAVDAAMTLIEKSEELVKRIEPVEAYLSAIIVLVKALVSLIIYIPVFSLIRLIATLITRVVCAIVIKKRKKNKPEYYSEDEDVYVKKEKAIGAAVGAVSGVLLSIVIFMPLMSGLKTANKVVGVVENFKGEGSIPESEPLVLLDKYSNDVTGTVLDACGGGMIFDLTTRITYDGQVSCLNNELDVIGRVDVEGIKSSFTDSEATTLQKIVSLEPTLDTVNDSVVMKLLVVDIIKNASTSWMEYEDFMGIPRPSLGSQRSMDEILDRILLVCSTTTFESYEMDVTTLMNVAKIVGENEEIFNAGDYNTFIEQFVDSRALQRIEDELDSNPHMSTVKYAINEMLMGAIVNELDVLDKYPDTVKREMYKKLASALTDTMSLNGSVRNVTLANDVMETFEERGIRIPDEISAKVAEALSEGVASKDGKITEKEVEAYINSFRE